MGVRTTITKRHRRQGTSLLRLHGERVCEALNRLHPHLDFYMDRMVAANVAIATYDDIDRYKAYHLRNSVATTRSDVVKRAAYFSKWIVKLRPIMFRRKGPTYLKPDLGLLANESFAIAYSMALFSGEFNQDISLTDKVFSDLQYDLHYRDITDDALMAFYQIIADLVRARQNGDRGTAIIEFGIL